MTTTDEERARKVLAEAATAYATFAVARQRMNEAVPPLDATRAERALYDERYKIDHEAHREHVSTAIRLAQHAETILAALADRAATQRPPVDAGEELSSIIACMEQMLDDPKLDALAFDKHDSRIILSALSSPQPSEATTEPSHGG